MDPLGSDHLLYRRCRFAARLPVERHYTRSHHWLLPLGEDRWRVGLTSFATRTLGEISTVGFDLQPDQPIQIDSPVGWIESFKAVEDLKADGEGRLLQWNPLITGRPELLNDDPWESGWLYDFSGTVRPDLLNVRQYATWLDGIIDEMCGPPSSSSAC